MGLFGVIAVGETYKVNKPMGIAYALPRDLRLFIVRAFNCTEANVEEVLCG